MDEKVKAFVKELTDWAEKAGFILQANFSRIELQTIIDSNYSELKELSIDQLSDYVFTLIKAEKNYRSVINKLNAIINYCNTNIDFAIGADLARDTAMVKNEIKVINLIKKDSLCKELFRVKNKCQSKLSIVDGELETILKISNIIETLIKRKSYARIN